jgi:hypothetical protein
METNTTTETANPPVAKLRLGLINASIWQRTTSKAAFYSVSFEHRYKDSEGKWQSTLSYDTADLLLLAKLTDQSHSKIVELQNERDRVADKGRREPPHPRGVS